MRNGNAGQVFEGDFSILVDGSVALVIPLSGAARTWLDEHCQADADHHYIGKSLAVELRYLAALIERAIEDGLRPMV
jgi:hypothetical protein